MSHLPFQKSVTTRLVCLGVFNVLIGLTIARPGYGQVAPDEHASHHPGQAGVGTSAAGTVLTGDANPAPGAMPGSSGGASSGIGGGPGMAGPPKGAGGMMGGGMGEMMAGMMKKMGVPPPKELYPALMALPELSREQRTQVEEQANERMHTGAVLMGQALDTLNAGTASDDYAAMHDAMTQLREGIAQLESGIAARRALEESRAPRDVALAWFKQEMNLSPGAATAAHQGSGVTVFHLFTMVLLIAFALAMVAMYFFKMRRAAALFGRIEASKGAPPPGSAPELAGGKPPSSGKPATTANKSAADTTATAL